MVVDIQQPVQSVIITTNDLSTNPAHGEVYSMQNHQHYFTDMVRSVSLAEETGLPEENHRPFLSLWQTSSHNIVMNTPHRERDSNTHG
jgi:hypothetical protein